MNNNVVLYHAHCQDGYAAAWVAWKMFGDTATYVAVKYGDEPPPYNGHNIFIVDFSYSKDQLIEMGKNNRVQVIDHHKTAMEDLKDFPTQDHHNTHGDLGVYVYFDMEHSGAVLTWKFFSGENVPNSISPVVPLILQMVEDRDLWKFKHPRSNHLHAYLASRTNMSFEEYDSLVENPAELDDALEVGAALRGHIMKQVEFVSTIGVHTKDNDGVGVALANSPMYQSDIGNALLDKYPMAEYADVFYMTVEEDKMVMHHSLRSRTDGTFDVSAIAKKQGGGGHRTAAGYRSYQ